MDSNNNLQHKHEVMSLEAILDANSIALAKIITCFVETNLPTREQAKEFGTSSQIIDLYHQQIQLLKETSIIPENFEKDFLTQHQNIIDKEDHWYSKRVESRFEDILKQYFLEIVQIFRHIKDGTTAIKKVYDDNVEQTRKATRATIEIGSKDLEAMTAEINSLKSSIIENIQNFNLRLTESIAALNTRVNTELSHLIESSTHLTQEITAIFNKVRLFNEETINNTTLFIQKIVSQMEDESVTRSTLLALQTSVIKFEKDLGQRIMDFKTEIDRANVSILQQYAQFRLSSNIVEVEGNIESLFYREEVEKVILSLEHQRLEQLSLLNSQIGILSNKHIELQNKATTVTQSVAQANRLASQNIENVLPLLNPIKEKLLEIKNTEINEIISDLIQNLEKLSEFLHTHIEQLQMPPELAIVKTIQQTCSEIKTDHTQINKDLETSASQTIQADNLKGKQAQLIRIVTNLEKAIEEITAQKSSIVIPALTFESDKKNRSKKKKATKLTTQISHKLEIFNKKISDVESAYAKLTDTNAKISKAIDLLFIIYINTEAFRGQTKSIEQVEQLHTQLIALTKKITQCSPDLENSSLSALEKSLATITNIQREADSLYDAVSTLEKQLEKQKPQLEQALSKQHDEHYQVLVSLVESLHGEINELFKLYPTEDFSNHPELALEYKKLKEAFVIYYKNFAAIIAEDKDQTFIHSIESSKTQFLRLKQQVMACINNKIALEAKTVDAKPSIENANDVTLAYVSIDESPQNSALCVTHTLTSFPDSCNDINLESTKTTDFMKDKGPRLSIPSSEDFNLDAILDKMVTKNIDTHTPNTQVPAPSLSPVRQDLQPANESTYSEVGADVATTADSTKQQIIVPILDANDNADISSPVQTVQIPADQHEAQTVEAPNTTQLSPSGTATVFNYNFYDTQSSEDNNEVEATDSLDHNHDVANNNNTDDKNKPQDDDKDDRKEQDDENDEEEQPIQILSPLEHSAYQKFKDFWAAHWKKILACALITGVLVVAGIFTAGIVPMIVGIGFGVGTAAAIGFGGGAVAGSLTGAGIGIIASKTPTNQDHGVASFLSRHKWKIIGAALAVTFIVGCVLTGGILAAFGVVAAGGALGAALAGCSLVVGGISTGVAATTATVTGVTLSATAATAIGVTTVTAGVATVGCSTGIMLGALSDAKTENKAQNNIVVEPVVLDPKRSSTKFFDGFKQWFRPSAAPSQNPEFKY